MASLTLLAGSREISLDIPEAGPAPSLLRLVYLSGLFEPPSLCAGLALCGRCRVRFLPESAEPPKALPEDLKALGQRAVEQGWRLGCRHRAAPGLRLELPPGVRLLEPVAAAEAAQTALPEVALAVDYGSTSLHYALVPIAEAEAGGGVENASELAPKIAVNPQMGAGSDIISRLAFAQGAGGSERLRELSQAALRRMLAEANRGDFGDDFGEGSRVREICLAANPAMTYLLLGLDVSGLAAAPYRLDYRGGCAENLPGLPPLWVAPLMGPFMGGDLSAGYAALAWGEKAEYPFVLADLGTNGEFVLALDENTALAASLPLGPALEGMGMSCGSEARPGVVTNFALTSDGLVPQMFGQSSPTRGLTAMPRGLAGTAYLALAGHLLAQGLLQADGLFSPAPDQAAPQVSSRISPQISPLAARLGRALLDQGQGRAFYLSPSLYMTGADLEELLKIKAAFTLALKLLLKTAGLKFSGLKRLYLAGALGRHAPLPALERLGFIPAGGAAKALPAGNTALAGAALLCRRPELRPALVDWAARVRVLGLAEDAGFQEGYAEEMRFSW